LPNYAEIPRIAELVSGAIVPRIPGIVLRNHGIYAWGANAFEAKRHLEAFEFLFEYVYRWQLLSNRS
jgi:methylthioribulose-1-phosphate dehydratase